MECPLKARQHRAERLNGCPVGNEIPRARRGIDIEMLILSRREAVEHRHDIITLPGGRDGHSKDGGMHV